MYALIENGQFVREVDIYAEFPNISFPDKSLIKDSDLPPNIVKVYDGVYPVSPTIRVVGQEVTLQNGLWTKTWITEPVEGLALVEITNQQWTVVRALRDEKISAFDWRILRNQREQRLGLPLTDSIEVLDKYMQDLANITNQGDPFNIVWPEKPYF
jgi:hypothetical protein